MLDDIRHLLEHSRAHRRAPAVDVWFLDSGPWWRFFSSDRSEEELRESILAAAWRLSSPLFLIPEEPLEPEVHPFVRREGDAWLVDKTTDAVKFYRTEPVFVFGNWLLYAAAAPVATPLPDTFDTTPASLLAFMSEHGVLLMIQSFHDNTEWCVAVGE